jgi:hypothetical protein
MKITSAVIRPASSGGDEDHERGDPAGIVGQVEARHHRRDSDDARISQEIGERGVADPGGRSGLGRRLDHRKV